MNKNELQTKNRKLIRTSVELAKSVGACPVDRELSRIFLTHVVAAGGYLQVVNYTISLPEIVGRLRLALDELNQAFYSLRMLSEAGAVDVPLADSFYVQSKELSAVLVCCLNE